MDKREKFLEKNSLDGGFLQSKHWINFQHKLKTTFYLIKSKKAQALVIENKLPVVGKYLYIPRGPIFTEDQNDDQMLLAEIKKIAVEKKAGWIRVEPQKTENLKEIKGMLVKAGKNHQPAETLVLDLKKDLTEILAGMKQKTRYNIRLAEKKGTEIKISQKSEDLNIFWELVQETAQRDGVGFHEKAYYQKMLEAIPQENLSLMIAYNKNKAVGAVLISFFGGVATYLHGASSSENRSLMANYLLQWEAIKKAKEKGMERYDFGGIAVNLNKKKWEGVTRFKKGFCSNCEPLIFPGCYDLVLCPIRYFIYRVLQGTIFKLAFRNKFINFKRNAVKKSL